MVIDDFEDDVRTLRKWLNEGLTCPIDRKSLANILHYMQSKLDERFDWTPEIDWETSDGN